MRYAPLPLMYLASAVRDHGYTPYIVIVDQGEDLLEETLVNIALYDPEIVAFSLMTDIVLNVFGVIDKVKEKFPGKKIIVGGYFATSLPLETMDDCKNIDYLIYGEGERTLVELLNALRDESDIAHIKGLVYRKNGRVIMNPNRELIQDIDGITLPAYDLVEEYDFPDDAQIGSKSMMVIASRGCPFECSFCCKAVFGRTYRRRSPESVVREIKLLTEKYGVDDINFGDALFNVDREWLETFYRGLNKEDIRIYWKCQTRLTGGLLEADYKKMKENGCEAIHFGIESGSDAILKELKKGFTTEEAFTRIKYAKNAGLAVAGSFVLGYKQDTVETVLQTFKFAKSLNLPIAFFKMLNPIPGSKDYAMLSREEKNYWKTGNLPKTCRNIDPEDLAAFTRYVQLIYYKSFRYLRENVLTAKFHPRIRKQCLAMWIASNIALLVMKRRMPWVKTAVKFIKNGEKT